MVVHTCRMLTELKFHITTGQYILTIISTIIFSQETYILQMFRLVLGQLVKFKTQQFTTKNANFGVFIAKIAGRGDQATTQKDSKSVILYGRNYYKI